MKVRQLHQFHCAIGEDLRLRVMGLSIDKALPLPELVQLNHDVSTAFADCAAAIIKQSGRKVEDITPCNRCAICHFCGSPCPAEAHDGRSAYKSRSVRERHDHRVLFSPGDQVIRCVRRLLVAQPAEIRGYGQVHGDYYAYI